VTATDANSSIRFCIRSYIAFVLAPEAPIDAWLAKLDGWTQRTPKFFASKPIVLDLGAARLTHADITHLLEQLAERGIRVIGVEGVSDSQLGPTLPPLLIGGRQADKDPAPSPDQQTSAQALPQEPASLLIETPIRSGQTIIFPNGDVTVLGSVASGSEIVAGGSIHVYGTLRGRALAGSQGNDRARIFCRKNEAELLAINGYFRTAEELDASIRCQPAQSWLENGVVMLAPLK
jgi:septum site-determining protein MinC